MYAQKKKQKQWSYNGAFIVVEGISQKAADDCILQWVIGQPDGSFYRTRADIKHDDSDARGKR